MEFIKSGKVSVFVLFLLCFAIIAIMLYVAKTREKPPKLRSIAGVAAIEEGIGRSVELGKPFAVDMHTSGLTSVDGVVALSYLAYCAEKAAVTGCDFVVGIGAPEVVAVAEDIIRAAYARSAKPEVFNPSRMIHYMGSVQFAYAGGWIGLVGREKPGAILIAGSMGAEAMSVGEAGQMVGAIQIAGSSSITNIPFFITSCDYVIMGEELYVGAAVVSGDKVQLGCTVGQDYWKILTIALVAIGAIMATLGFKDLGNILKI
jgi:hypothetical protein